MRLTTNRCMTTARQSLCTDSRLPILLRLRHNQRKVALNLAESRECRFHGLSYANPHPSRVVLARCKKMEDAMATVRIHRFRLYDINSDTYRVSRRWATRDTIELLGGDIVESPAVEVDASVVGREIEGLTEIDYDPFLQKAT